MGRTLPDNSRAHYKNNFFFLFSFSESAGSDALIIILIRTDPGTTQHAIRIHGEKLKKQQRPSAEKCAR